jgi:hypothetical protein
MTLSLLNRGDVLEYAYGRPLAILYSCRRPVAAVIVVVEAEAVRTIYKTPSELLQITRYDQLRDQIFPTLPVTYQ